ncbi:MAG TPA: LuxR family transcriptional regulator, partial [Candidatus Acetothermia bacterium]|nr:LuxR family transcriptional regulator [Candidatus Acetothermia bacterium]
HREELERWRHFLEHVLTPAERKVVEELVLRGGTNAEIARRLRKSPRTVEHQLESAYRKLRAFLDWPENFPINRTTLVSLLAPFVRESPLLQMGVLPDARGTDALLYKRKRR